MILDPGAAIFVANNNNTPTWNSSLCTDVPTPSEKNREKIFFLREGGRLYTGYWNSYSSYLGKPD